MKIEKLGRVTAASLKKGSGRNWDEWFALLEKAGAKNWSRSEIVQFLKKKYKVSTWWQQIVASGFDVHLGRRIEGQNSKGLYTATVTKTFPQNAKAVWKMVTSPEGISIWLNPLAPVKLKPKQEFECEGGIFGEIRTVRAGAIRLRWQDLDWEKPTAVMIHVVQRQQGNSILAIDHGQLKSAKIKEGIRAHWRKAVEALYSSMNK